MRRAVPLFEFMPYGAPELLESHRGALLRALLLASALALAAGAVTAGVLALLPRSADPPREFVFEIESWEASRPLLPRAPVRPPVERASAPVVPAEATPVPVRDAVAPALDATAPVGPRVEDAGAASGAGPASEGGATGAAFETLPARGDYVYVESIPSPRREVRPEYPEIALRAGVEGRVTVHVLVGRDGRVLDAVLAERDQVPMLNEAALTAARQWLFTPGLANGHPVACWTAIPFRFRLD